MPPVPESVPVQAPYSRATVKAPISKGTTPCKKSRDQRCNKCKGETFHFHISTDFDREAALKLSKDTVHCFVCGVEHGVATPARRKILLTSSTLIYFWRAPGFIAPIHFEVEAIVGARVRDLTKVLKQRYSSKPAPMDVVICAGINNVGEGQAEADTLREFADLQNEIYDLSLIHI